ncbi:MAG: electron transfer flavoprotein-ubiquinone oxidoreductase [Planctomycetes bacterium]|nr:electron transfer flavoprotein-ubiquinone oxidoreductase [Planctomycetota bacterium]
MLAQKGILEIFKEAGKGGLQIHAKVKDDAWLWLSEKSHKRMSGLFCPPQFKNHGNWITSANEMTKWLEQKAEAAGVEVYPGFAAASALRDESGAVCGIRCVDQGLNKEGEQKATYAPGYDIKARLTVFAEGTRGSVTKQLIKENKLDADRNPQIWGVGVKEIWEVDHDLEGTVLHTGGWPLGTEVYGGGWIYGLPNNRLSVGFVMGMDHGNASFDYHAAMQRWKQHPFMADLLKGGKLIRYGAKTVPEGGLFSMPQSWGDGFMLVGDAAGYMNAARLKGLHLAIKSGTLAASAALEALADTDGIAQGEKLSAVDKLFSESWAHTELSKVRNYRQGFQKGFVAGSIGAALGTLTGGALPGGKKPLKADHELYKKGAKPNPLPKFDGELTFDKLSNVYLSGSIHEEDQPCHLQVLDTSICVDKCTEEYGNPCQHFCPAAVYEFEADNLMINASNCVHCKTCDIADPYENINWVVPAEGGPVYTSM